MSSEELNELQEHAEHAKHDPSLAPVSLTMAVLAVLVAVVSLGGHRAHTEGMVRTSKKTSRSRLAISSANSPPSALGRTASTWPKCFWKSGWSLPRSHCCQESGYFGPWGWCWEPSELWWPSRG